MRMRCAGGEKKCVQNFSRKSCGEEAIWRRCEDSIKMDHRKIRCGSVDWIKVALNGIQQRPFVRETFDFHKSREFRKRLSNYKLFKK